MDDKMNDFLEKSLDRVNNWLQFAEAKHAALIAFLVAVLAIIYGGDFIDDLIMKTIVAIMYLIALIISITSFYPRYDKNTWQPSGEYNTNDNLLFWKDIAKYSQEDFLKKVYKDFFSIDKNSFSSYEKLYAQEIIANARIARKKYELFQIAVKVVIAATVLIPVFLIIIA